jgi:hypothetical protein
MTDITDTSADPARRLIAMFERPGARLTLYGIDVAATLHALLARAEKAEAERDEAIRDRQALAQAIVGKTGASAILTAPKVVARWNRAEAERDRMRAEVASLRLTLGDKDEALLRIAQWAEAYPEDIFPPVDLDAARLKLGDDALFSRLHAEWARRLCKGLGAIARAALKETGHE